MSEEFKNIGIKSWAEEDRPREKLLQQGRRAVSDAELIAILIGSGSRNETAVELSRRILLHYQSDLNALGIASVQDLSKFKGIGEAKAITIVAALELGRRRKQTTLFDKPTIACSKDAFDYIQATFADLQHEEFWIILLNRAHKIITKELVSKGGVASTIVDAKIVFKLAIEKQASSIILAHNHPSGSNKPSEEDKKLTQKLKLAGQLLDITIADHLIFFGQSYFSFTDEGLL